MPVCDQAGTPQTDLANALAHNTRLAPRVRRLGRRPSEAPGQKGLVETESPSFGGNAFGLFDDDPAGQSGLELRFSDAVLFDGALLEDGDGGDVRWVFFSS
ncbi:hypothetical protein ACFU96_43335 [Streptomyces sp. NPDC057620]|uniref:hypothetical protein n=1 Tax=Streptomyces sp. NPDC057620 TaxID=3346185 RepID=UPI00367E0D1F